MADSNVHFCFILNVYNGTSEISACFVKVWLGQDKIIAFIPVQIGPLLLP